MSGIGRADETPQINVREQATQLPQQSTNGVFPNSTFGEGFKTEGNTMGWTPSSTEDNSEGDIDGGQLPEVVKKEKKDNKLKKLGGDFLKNSIPGIGPFVGLIEIFKGSDKNFHSVNEKDKNGNKTGNKIEYFNILDEKGNKIGIRRERIVGKNKKEISHKDFNEQNQLVSEVMHDENGMTKTDFEYDGDALVKTTKSRFEDGDIKSKTEITYADDNPTSITVTDNNNTIAITNSDIKINGQVVTPDAETNIVKLPYNEEIANQSELLFNILELNGFDANQEEGYIELEFTKPELE